ncbi:MAG: ferric reductase-like transmembrane domain-containing protein [Acidimicrobiales bacterium]
MSGLAATATVAAQVTPKFWWYAARSAGIVAWALAAAAVVWGLLLSTRTARGVAKPSWVLDLHRYLGAISLAFVGIHMAALIADTFVPFTLADLFVPGASAWKTTAVGLGVVAFWLLVVVEVSSLLKRRISNRLWARLHLLSFVVYVLATLHYLQAGTERTNPAMQYAVVAVTAIVIFLTVLRVLTPRQRGKKSSTASAARPTSAVPSDSGSRSRPVAT